MNMTNTIIIVTKNIRGIGWNLLFNEGRPMNKEEQNSRTDGQGKISVTKSCQGVNLSQSLSRLAVGEYQADNRVIIGPESTDRVEWDDQLFDVLTNYWAPIKDARWTFWCFQSANHQ